MRLSMSEEANISSCNYNTPPSWYKAHQYLILQSPNSHQIKQTSYHSQRILWKPCWIKHGHLVAKQRCFSKFLLWIYLCNTIAIYFILGFNKSGNILFLGLDFAGKTTLLGLLKDGRFHQSAPTHYARKLPVWFSKPLGIGTAIMCHVTADGSKCQKSSYSHYASLNISAWFRWMSQPRVKIDFFLMLINAKLRWYNHELTILFQLQ